MTAQAPSAGDSSSLDEAIRAERVKAAIEQTPVAALVNIVNAGLMVAVLIEAGLGSGIVYWFCLALLVSAIRFAVWWTYHRSGSWSVRIHRWDIGSTGGALLAGVLWGGGSVILFPESEIHQLFWAFLIAGMCAGAAALHYAHLPTALCFILPAGLPLAIRFALEGSARRAAAAAMIAVFVAALAVTARRSSRYFGEMLRLRLDLAARTRELDAMNARLQTELARLHATEEHLRHSQKLDAVGQLTGGIAHDFNNILTAVLGNLELLRKRLPADDAKVRRLLDNAARGGERGAELTQRLLAFGRRQVLRPTAVAVPSLVRGMSGLLQSSIGPGVRITTRFPEVLPDVQVDANQLELALLNLFLNARDAMPNGGEIVVTAREEPVRSTGNTDLLPGDYVVLTVSDTGEGMDQETLTRAVEPFFTTKGVGKGTGLGLPMVHGLAAQSRGQLILRSQKGVGTEAELWLPNAKMAAAPAAVPTVSPHAIQSRARRILLVDDDQLVLASTAAMLEDLGHTTMTAQSGREALTLVESGTKPDLVITDYAMPGMTGLQLIEQLRQLSSGTPTVLATGYGELAEVGPELLRLQKPFTQHSLAQSIAQATTAVR